MAGPPTPAVYSGMVDAKPSFNHHFFQVSVTSVTEGVPQIPPQAKQDDFGLKVAILEEFGGAHSPL